MAVDFKKFNIRKKKGIPLYSIYCVIDNGKSKVLREFYNLSLEERENLIELISNMATIKNFQSIWIRYKLTNYDYGEVKSHQDRFFFFQKCGKNYIIFDHELKKSGKLSDHILQRIQKKKERYEKEFQRFISRN